LAGKVGEGVFGPFDEDAVVYDECELPFRIDEDPSDPSDPREPTRGDEVPDEYACCGCGKGREGSLSFTYSGR
jgi:hypothetical protein